MKNILNKFYTLVDKIGKQNFILIIFVFIVILITGLYSTFSIYTSSDGVSILDGITTYKFVLSNKNATNSVTIASESSKYVDITVTNSEKLNLQYGIYYTLSDNVSNINLGYRTDTLYLPRGVIEKNSDYIVSIKIDNNSSNNVTIDFGIYYGFENGGDLTLSANQYWVEEYKEENLYNLIKSNAVMDNTSSTYVTSTSGIDFSSVSSDTNGKGVYIKSGTENDTYPIYYYRGAVENNNVLFANLCWKIVRTTVTGGIKLIYNGIPIDENCSNTGEDSQIGSSAFNSSYDSPAYVGYMYGAAYSYSSKNMSSQTETWYFGNGVTYSNGKYSLTKTKTLDLSSWSSDYNTLNSNHYTCFSKETMCSTVYYIYFTDSNYAYYISLTGGKTVEDALDEMLTSSSNMTNSTIKTAIDTWYETNMTAYTDYLEDTVWCNDRSISSLGGWSPFGGGTADELSFSPYNRVYMTYTPSLECSNTNDAFTVSSENGNGALMYPIALLTADEIMLAGGHREASNSSYYLYTGQEWWSLSGGVYDSLSASSICMDTLGNLSEVSLNNICGIRPVISLLHGVNFTKGEGSEISPFILSEN